MSDVATIGGVIAASVGVAPSLDQIERLEREIAMLPSRLPDLPVFHHFAPGVYAREMRIPAGVLVTGKIHKTTHLNIVSAGELTVWTEDGMKRIRAPFTFVSKPGTKRVGLAHEDTVWTTIHATNETDLEKIEAEVIEPSDNLVGLEYGCQFSAIDGGAT